MRNIFLGNWLEFLESILPYFQRICKVLKDSDWTMSLKDSAKEHNSK